MKVFVMNQRKLKNAPFGKNCRDVLDAMLDMAKRDGFETKDIDGYAGVVEYGQGEETFGVLGHLDIVPLGEGWTKDPLKSNIRKWLHLWTWCYG